jgi:NB-ARC domain
MSDIPKLPTQYRQPMEQAQVEQLILAGVDKISVYGLPGVGKTALVTSIAAKVEQDSLPPMQRPVLWAYLGQAPDPVSVLRNWCQELHVPIPPYTGKPALEDEYLRGLLRDALADRPLLLVLDDMGPNETDVAAARACCLDGTRCRYLVTTISEWAARHFAGTRLHSVHVDQLGPQASKALLEAYADGTLSAVHPSEHAWERLLQLGGGLPLSLMILGRLLADSIGHGATLQSVLDRLRHAEAMLQPAEGGGDQDQIAVDTVLMTRWQTLSSTTQKPLSPPRSSARSRTSSRKRRGRRSSPPTVWPRPLPRMLSARRPGNCFTRPGSPMRRPAWSSRASQRRRKHAGRSRPPVRSS